MASRRPSCYDAAVNVGSVEAFVPEFPFTVTADDGMPGWARPHRPNDGPTIPPANAITTMNTPVAFWALASISVIGLAVYSAIVIAARWVAPWAETSD